MLSYDIIIIILLSWFMQFVYHIFFWVVSLALGQSYDCTSANEVTLKDMGKIN